MEQDRNKGQGMTRREFLKLTGVLAGTAALSACGPSSLPAEATSNTATTGTTTSQSATSNILTAGLLPIPPLLAPQLQNGT